MYVPRLGMQVPKVETGMEKPELSIDNGKFDNGKLRIAVIQ